MADEAALYQQPRLITEDHTFGSGVTYTTGGMLITVANGITVDKLLVTQKDPLAMGVNVGAGNIWAPLQSSESGQAVKIIALTTSASGLIELANAISISGEIVRLFYQGN